MKFDSETYVVFVAFITAFFGVFLSAGIVLGVPSIAAEFGMNNVEQNWITTIALLLQCLPCRQDRFQESTVSRNH